MLHHNNIADFLITVLQNLIVAIVNTFDSFVIPDVKSDKPHTKFTCSCCQPSYNWNVVVSDMYFTVHVGLILGLYETRSSVCAHYVTK